jgi:tripartite-type tricarboxylate transporter receptor subunit TctC
VTLAAATPVVLAVNPEVPAKTVKELVAWIKANPGKESYASPGTGTPPQLTGALFVHALNLDLVHVPFSGGGTAVEATVGNHTPISFGAMAPAVPLIKAGQLRALAVTGKARSPALPDVPTMAEAGYPEVEGATWTAIVVPKGTPKDIVDKLNAAAVKTLTDPGVRQKLEAQGFEIPPPEQQTPAALAAYQKAEIEKWWPIVRAAGIKPE